MKNFSLRKWKAGFDTYVFLFLIALEFLVSFTFLGYIHIPPISITTAYIPILIAACLLTPGQTMVLGLVFGFASMFKATAYYVMPLDQIFSPFLSGFPMGSFLLSIGTRTLFGFLTGVLFTFFKKKPHFPIWAGILSAIAPKFHALLVYLAMELFFPEAGYTITHTFSVVFNDLLVSLLCVCIIEAVWKLFHSRFMLEFRSCIEQAETIPAQKNILYSSWTWIIAVGLLMTIASTAYFAQRMAYMLNVHGLELSSEIRYDLLHLQIQFVAAMLALCMIVGVILVLVYKYMSYRQYLSELDGLTGLMNRKIFFNYCNRLLSPTNPSAPQEGYFIFLDIDFFKSINDTMGHPTGDIVLKSVAQIFQQDFSYYGRLGRVGGDEFTALLKESLSTVELRKLLDAFEEHVADILPAYGPISCSIGVTYFTQLPDFQDLFAQTDAYLYEAKKRGRAQYVIGKYKVES